MAGIFDLLSKLNPDELRAQAGQWQQTMSAIAMRLASIDKRLEEIERHLVAQSVAQKIIREHDKGELMGTLRAMNDILLHVHALLDDPQNMRPPLTIAGTAEPFAG